VNTKNDVLVAGEFTNVYVALPAATSSLYQVTHCGMLIVATPHTSVTVHHHTMLTVSAWLTTVVPSSCTDIHSIHLISQCSLTAIYLQITDKISLAAQVT
jgi:hypothetical protein